MSATEEDPVLAVPAQTIARHGRLTRTNPVLRVLQYIAGILTVILISTVAVVAYTAGSLLGNTDIVELEPLAPGESLPQIGEMEGGTNILIVGTDTREGKNSAFGKVEGQRNDVTLLVHISEDQKNIYAISIPRDLIVTLPRCEKGPGWTTSIDVALSRGGLACVVTTVESLTGLDIPYAAMISFDGVIQMSNAVGGVDICVTGGNIFDRNAKVNGKPLSLKQGEHTIKGATALAFLRTRYGVGDGSDLGRISNQQTYLSSLVRKVKSDETLTDYVSMYNLAQAATRNMTLSSSLANVDTLIALVRILAKIDMDRVIFLQYPGTTGSKEHPNRVVPVKSAADELFTALKNGETVVPAKNNTGRGSTTTETVEGHSESGAGSGTSDEEKTSTLPTAVKGQLATDVTCSVAK